MVWFCCSQAVQVMLISLEQEAESYKSLLMLCFRGDISAVKNMIDNVQALRRPFLDPVQPVAVIAAKKAHVELLKLASEKGARMDDELCIAVKHGAKSDKGRDDSYLQGLRSASERLDKPLTGRRVPPGFDPGDRFDDLNW